MNMFENIYRKFWWKPAISAGVSSLVEIASDPTFTERFILQKEALLSVSKDTEQEFVSFGREAGSLYSQAKTILSKVNEVLEGATGDGARQAVDFFELLIADFEQLIAKDRNEVTTLISEMTGLSGQIETLFRHREVIDDAARLPLALLKIGFRVEGASRLQAITKILDAVGVEASVLGKKVVASTNAQFLTLETAAISMKELILSLHGMREEADRTQSETTIRIHELKRHVEQLREVRLDQDKVGQEIEATGKELQQEFNRVVMALQYHDITRQQLEHIAETFESTLSGSMPSVSSSESAALLHQTAKIQVHQTQAALGSLKMAGKEFQQGMDQILCRANDLERNVMNFQSFCRNEKVFEALQGLEALQSMMDERTMMKQGISEAACLIFEKVTDCTSTLNELTLDLRILAINAQVQAANAKHHEVVEMLAKEMCDVSNAIKRAAEALTLDMTAIMKQLALAARAWKLGTKQSKEGRIIHKEVPHCIKLLTEIQEKVTIGLAESESLQADLRSRIVFLLGKVNFPLVASDRLLPVLRFFREVEAETQPMGEHSEVSLSVLASMETNYTMASERKVHALAVTESLETAGLPVAPITVNLSDSSQSEVKPAAPSGEEFGDNIELF